MGSSAPSIPGGLWTVDPKTGSVPSRPPLSRLPPAWETWEAILDLAVKAKLVVAERAEKLEDQHGTAEMSKSRTWREHVKKMPIIPTAELETSEELLRRAHHVLSYMLHFYGHTVPSKEPISIPRSLSIPLLQVSKHLRIPPIITYVDITISNWRTLKYLPDGSPSSIDGLHCQTTFTGTPDENEFYLLSIRIEFCGGEALEALKLALDEARVGDDASLIQAAQYLDRAASVIQDLKGIMLNAKGRITPEVFYNEIRPWLIGAGGDCWGRSWVYESSEEVNEWAERWELSGATAAQSPLIRALDIFLGVEWDGGQSSYSAQSGKKSFQERMLSYMTLQHRTFLQQLHDDPCQLRAVVQDTLNEKGAEFPLVKMYNKVLKALKEFRDAHMIVVTLLVIGPARRAAKGVIKEENHVSVSKMSGSSYVREGGERCNAI